MTPHNNTIRLALNAATAALFQLEDVGCTVVEVRIEGGHPQITVDRAPSNVPAVMRTAPTFHSPDTQSFGDLLGCRVRWNERRSIAQLEGERA